MYIYINTIMLTKAEVLSLPTLYTITDLAPIITKFFNAYLGHLNLVSPVLEIPSITLDVVKSRRTLSVSMPYSNTYDYYNVWQMGILKYNTIPNLLLFNDTPNLGPLIYQLGDINITKTILYTISQQMEVVKDGFAYYSFDSVLNYRDDPNNIVVLL